MLMVQADEKTQIRIRMKPHLRAWMSKRTAMVPVAVPVEAVPAVPAGPVVPVLEPEPVPVLMSAAVPVSVPESVPVLMSAAAGILRHMKRLRP